jgi:hypothetical protein
MKRFLLHSLSHTTLIVDITQLGLPTTIYPPQGEPDQVPVLRFQSWNHAANYLVRAGADDEAIQKAASDLRNTSLAVVTIV